MQITGGPLYGCMFLREELRPIPQNTSIKHLYSTDLPQQSRSCSLEAHYWRYRRWAPSPNQRKNFLHPAALLTLLLVREGKGKSSHRTAGRGRTEIQSFIYHHLFAPPSPFNPPWESYKVFRISLESVMTNTRVWKHLDAENLSCEMVWNPSVWHLLGRVPLSSVVPFPREGWAKPRAEQGQVLCILLKKPS